MDSNNRMTWLRNPSIAALIVLAWIGMPQASAEPFAFESGNCGARGKTYHKKLDGAERFFNFDGSRPFVNSASGKSDIRYMDFDGSGLYSEQITNRGSGTEHIKKMRDPIYGGVVTRIQVLPEDKKQYGYRTQLNSFPLDSGKLYCYELEFRLDDAWDFDMKSGAGILWQLKGHAKENQYGHPVLSIELVGPRLKFTILYPSRAMQPGSWPRRITWGSGDYVKVPIMPQTVSRGRFYSIGFHFYADDRPAAHGGRGFIVAYFDHKHWFTYIGPTLHPDQEGPHRVDFGWYQWEGRPDSPRIVYFRKAHLYEESESPQ